MLKIAKNLKPFIIVIWFFGLAFLFLGFYNPIYLLSKGERVSGEVIGLDYSEGAQYPTVEYTSKSGQFVNYFQRGQFTDAKVGEKVEVIYDPNDLGNASIYNWFYRWGIWVILPLILIAMLAISKLFLSLANQSKKTFNE